MLTLVEKQRYARHFTLPEVGEAGQEKLKQSSVLCIGTGGLGSPVALYLAAAGVGRIGLVDADHVESSNLQRQIIHSESWVGKPKLESAKARLKEINPFIKIECHEARFTATNAKNIASNYDIILDGTDNFPTRYLSNDVAYFLGKPNIYGSIFRFEGQLSVFAPHLGGSCYRCMLPMPPAPDAVPSCAEAGVLGVLPGIIGSMQAMEAIKILLEIGNPLLGKLVHYDALNTEFRNFTLRKDPECALCGNNPTITELIDYDGFCGIPNTSSMTEITVIELKEKLDAGFDGILVDVRTPAEVSAAALDGTTRIPLQEIADRYAEIPTNKTIYIHCKAGGRSAKACAFLAAQGITNTVNIKGGIDAWRDLIDPSLPPA